MTGARRTVSLIMLAAFAFVRRAVRGAQPVGTWKTIDESQGSENLP